MTRDYNGQQQEGFGPMEATIHNGVRWSAANAYLKPAIKTGKVQVVRAFARRVVIEQGRALARAARRGLAGRGDRAARCVRGDASPVTYAIPSHPTGLL